MEERALSVEARGKSLISALLRCRFVHDSREELSFVSRSSARSQDAILDTACGQMVQHCVIRHRQHARIIFMRSRRVEDALAEKHG